MLFVFTGGDPFEKGSPPDPHPKTFDNLGHGVVDYDCAEILLLLAVRYHSGAPPNGTLLPNRRLGWCVVGWNLLCLFIELVYNIVIILLNRVDYNVKISIEPRRLQCHKFRLTILITMSLFLSNHVNYNAKISVELTFNYIITRNYFPISRGNYYRIYDTTKGAQSLPNQVCSFM